MFILHEVRQIQYNETIILLEYNVSQKLHTACGVGAYNSIGS